VASRLAVESITDSLTSLNGEDPGSSLVRSLEHANDVVLDDSAAHEERAGMGTTAVVAYLPDSGDEAWVAHVGDSRAYVLRGGQLVQVTEDHTTGGMFGRGQITQAIGNYDGVEPDVVSVELEHGDRLLLCTDGLTDMLTDAEIAALAGPDRTPQAACDALVEATLARGAMDNVTVVIAAVPDEPDA
jgi:PPM family protein phosphatase